MRTIELAGRHVSLAMEIRYRRKGKVRLMEPIIFERLLPLEGGFNLRDLGGYPTVGGGHVKRGMLYRSGTMALLSTADGQSLADLGITTICDFRRQDERALEPTLWAETHGIHLIARDYKESSGVLLELLKRPDANAVTMRNAMIDLYREIPYDHAPSYQAMFERLLAGHVPLLFNCSAGKDRTGVAAVLILHALGVAQDVILEDYLLTNRHADFARLLKHKTGVVAALAQNAPEVVAPVLAVETAYLQALFDTLDSRHGSIDTYLDAVLGVGQAERERLRALLVES